MPLSTAIMSSIAIPKGLPPIVYEDSKGRKHHLFDGGAVTSFPLVPEEISPRTTTVLGILINYYVPEIDTRTYKGTIGEFTHDARKAAINDYYQIRYRIMALSGGLSVEDLENGDFKNQEILLHVTGDFGIHPYAINIPPGQRLELIKKGEEEAQRIYYTLLRRPLNLSLSNILESFKLAMGVYLKRPIETSFSIFR